ncbi:MAG: hypothetical protein Q8908_01095 [Bacteroidota bacterium]|nr:hypothetical protein [Bacteroidota bacterium]
MKPTLLIIAYCLLILSATAQINKSQFISYRPVRLSENEKQDLKKLIQQYSARYDDKEKMVTTKINGYNYHTDAEVGIYHEVRASLAYAVALLDLDDEKYTQRAFEIIEKTITLQDTNKFSPTCGIWPYYLEEPLATKKSPPDFNWADFNGVSLLDILLDHEAVIPKSLKPKIEQSLICAARSIQKRNIGPGYTNIAIMGTYVTYVTAHLLDIPDLKTYAQQRLKTFYNYTLEKGGFSEYNSPNYTPLALDELARMKRHITNSEAKPMIDSLYAIGWNIIAHHFHQPTGQWAGPHSRSYSSLIKSNFYGLLKQASNGKIDLGYNEQSIDKKVKHEIPSYLLPYFLTPKYPRTEVDLFEKSEPVIKGTTYLTDTYTLASASRSSLWNQRRPFIAYWGTIAKPSYLQVRFLHDSYDFSSASFYSQQKENNILAGINFILNGGDKHISIDQIKTGKFKAKDLRLRFEFGNYLNPENLTIPNHIYDPLKITIDHLQFNLQLFYAGFENMKGHWEKGGDNKSSWIDYVVYSGQDKEFDLKTMKEAVLGFTFSIGTSKDLFLETKPEFTVKDNILDTNWNGFNLKIFTRPSSFAKNL